MLISEDTPLDERRRDDLIESFQQSPQPRGTSSPMTTILATTTTSRASSPTSCEGEDEDATSSRRSRSLAGPWRRALLLALLAPARRSPGRRRTRARRANSGRRTAAPARARLARGVLTRPRARSADCVAAARSAAAAWRADIASAPRAAARCAAWAARAAPNLAPCLERRQIAAAGQLTREPRAVAVPDARTQHAGGGPRAAALDGARVSFPPSELVWEHYAGQGIADPVARRRSATGNGLTTTRRQPAARCAA